MANNRDGDSIRNTEVLQSYVTSANVDVKLMTSYLKCADCQMDSHNILEA
eukprot:CAMPEP_0185043400 /NCGR_PEP_ID=MMETSP1103-20130426/42880_1 /TAXON_ID=36769 /ORGANISM="Paraphysomonas bandaiensis, Strain Caron Lab Isolate" /LENGTH=49 /DNA_ID=CAMNT_0027583569 /DNA_START=1230 /DNA_END=1379 /DNA_ORIENTATION=-